MKYVETKFSKELLALLLKYKKTLTTDKTRIYVTDDKQRTKIIIALLINVTSEDIEMWAEKQSKNWEMRKYVKKILITTAKAILITEAKTFKDSKIINK